MVPAHRQALQTVATDMHGVVAKKMDNQKKSITIVHTLAQDTGIRKQNNSFVSF